MNIEHDIFDYLETTSLEPYDDYTSEISYKNQKIIWNRLKTQQKEIERLNNIINELENILKLMINHGYYDTPNGDYEGTAVQGFMATGENSEFGIRAKFILDKLKELKESGNNEK